MNKPLPTPGYRPPAFQYSLQSIFCVLAVVGLVSWLGPFKFLFWLGCLIYGYIGLAYALWAARLVLRK